MPRERRQPGTTPSPEATESRPVATGGRIPLDEGVAPGTPSAAPRPPGGHYVEEGLRRRNGRGGHGQGCRCSARTFAVDVLSCPPCHGRMRLLAVIKEPSNIARYLAAVGEATEAPCRSPGRGRATRRRGRRGGVAAGDAFAWDGPRAGVVCAFGAIGATGLSPGGGEQTCRTLPRLLSPQTRPA